MSTVPGGDSLPSGVSLFFDPSVNAIAPEFYGLNASGSLTISGGIPIGDIDGNYSGVETDWGFAARVCANIGGGTGRFRDFYSGFVSC